MHPFGVIFDMDGVLVDSRAAHLESWVRLGAEIGRPIGETEFAGGFGRTSWEFIHETLGVPDLDEVKRLERRKEEIYRDLIRGRVPAMPGASELVASLHGAGAALAVGSSGPAENVSLVCEELRIGRFLRAVVTADDVTRGKPDPQVFLIAAERIGLPASRCVVVEDAPVGIEAARAAGMKVIALAGTHVASALGRADRVVSALNEIKPAQLAQLRL
ncbi:MAG: beta-phosphoglucomutase [Phycisphaerae bacterium]|nr:MAG: hypothetical protein DCC66_04780 [Planctomycetota bacterium]GJQ26279.1 MAG: beta-phosphoglucomutase [Phycisphaerae bacterium]